MCTLTCVCVYPSSAIVHPHLALCLIVGVDIAIYEEVEAYPGVRPVLICGVLADHISEVLAETYPKIFYLCPAGGFVEGVVCWSIQACLHLNLIQSHFNPLCTKLDQSTVIVSTLRAQLIARDYNHARCPLLVHMIGHAFINRFARSADMSVRLLFHLLLRLRETKETTSFGEGMLDQKGSG